ncbi:MAG: alpha/beta fold hydrolase [Congregibacter sp.]
MSNAMIDRAFLRLDEGLVHYRERPGEGTQPPLLMLHASPNSSRSLEPILTAYSEGRRLIAPDTPGCGDSARPVVEQPAIADYADAMDRFCDALGLGAVDVFGSHTGAHIGLELAVRKPERVRRLVVDGLLVMSDSERDDFLANYAPHKAPDASGSQFHWAWQYIRDQMIFFPHFRKDIEHLRAGGVFDADFLHRMTMDILGSLETYHLTYEAVFRHAVAEALSAVTCPVRWLDTGEGYLDAGMHLLRDTAAQASIVQLKHTPDAFAEQIAVFCLEA